MRARLTACISSARAGNRCSATRRDGQPCQAPAVEGTLVCRRHGGSARQVLIAAQLRLLQLAFYTATREWEDARGTPGEFDALCRWSRAERELRAYEAKLRLLAELRAELKRSRAGPGTVRTS
ncbi:MAG: HGGxSTG domain-containing protein [Streptosporangiaceae bacterium]